MKTVVIIGAGPAGLTAAYDLKKQSGNELRVILLEESGEIGGISRTVRHNGCRIDLGEPVSYTHLTLPTNSPG